MLLHVASDSMDVSAKRYFMGMSTEHFHAKEWRPEHVTRISRLHNSSQGAICRTKTT